MSPRSSIWGMGILRSQKCKNKPTANIVEVVLSARRTATGTMPFSQLTKQTHLSIVNAGLFEIVAARTQSISRLHHRCELAKTNPLRAVVPSSRRTLIGSGVRLLKMQKQTHLSLMDKGLFKILVAEVGNSSTCVDVSETQKQSHWQIISVNRLTY